VIERTNSKHRCDVCEFPPIIFSHMIQEKLDKITPLVALLLLLYVIV
jgi:hypothetical protein